MFFCVFPSISQFTFSSSAMRQALTPVAGSIFGPLSQTQFSKSEFKNEISSSALLDFQLTLLCVYGVDSFIPELEHWMETICHGLFSKKKSLKSDSWIQIHEMKLRSTSSAEENFPDKITWITWKNLEIWQFLKSILEKRVWESGPKIDPATGVNCEQIQLLFFFNFSPNFLTNFFFKSRPVRWGVFLQYLWIIRARARRAQVPSCGMDITALQFGVVPLVVFPFLIHSIVLRYSAGLRPVDFYFIAFAVGISLQGPKVYFEEFQ